jgi:GNAT superfamily N-acetyltransferase
VKEKMMIYELAKTEELQIIYNVVQHTIKTIYPKYYPIEVVDFFCEHHSKSVIANDIKKDYVSVLKIDDKIVATGCFVDNHITRVYVLPEYQKKGYGTFVMKQIEEQISEKYDKAYLDASLPAAAFYEKLGFSTIKHERYPVENDVVLAYEIMEKELHKITTEINYDGRRFIPKMNSENGEVSEQTVFTYHQNGSLLWAEYSGGDILKGSLIGSVLGNGELDFVYHHMNRDMQIKTGRRHSVPTVLENGKMEISEHWKWTSGDYSKGESLMIEV